MKSGLREVWNVLNHYEMTHNFRMVLVWFRGWPREEKTLVNLFKEKDIILMEIDF